MKVYKLNKTVVKHIDKTCDMDILDMLDYGKKIIERYNYSSILNEKIKKHGYGRPSKNIPKV